MEKPCGEECANEDSVFHNGVAQPERFGVLEHPLQGFDDIRRIKLLKAGEGACARLRRPDLG